MTGGNASTSGMMISDHTHMESHEQHTQILEQLERLNTAMDKQSKTGYQFREGVVRGVGFFIGSAILATILLGALAPFFGKIEWVRDNYQAGEEILK